MVGFGGSTFVADDFNHGRQYRQHDDGHQYQTQIVFDHVHIAEVIAQIREQSHPHHRPDDVVSQEGMVMHVTHASDKRREGAHDGNEARHDDGFATVFGIKLLGFVQMALLEDFGMRIGEQFLAKKFAYHEVDRIAQNRGDDEQ